MLNINFQKNYYSQICVSYSWVFKPDKSERIITFACFLNYE